MKADLRTSTGTAACEWLCSRPAVDAAAAAALLLGPMLLAFLGMPARGQTTIKPHGLQSHSTSA